MPTLSLQQVEQKENSNWVILNRKVYNIGDFYAESREFPADVKIVEGWIFCELVLSSGNQVTLAFFIPIYLCTRVPLIIKVLTY